MRAIPPAALALGLVGLIPFIWSALTGMIPELGLWTAQTIGPRFSGPYVGLSYGTVILSFMSGVLWGFSTRADAPSVAASGYALSVIPALWAFIMVGGGPISAGMNLIFGFIGLLGLDWLFWHHRLAPPWWMHLRAPLSIIVVLSLGANVFF